MSAPKSTDNVNMIELSVVVPIYNTPKDLLRHCLTSILENLSTMNEEVEVFLINDGSTEVYIDSLLTEVSEKDKRISYIKKSNTGLSNTRNFGIKKARGEYITFVDADDYLEPSSLKYMLDVAQSRSEDVVMFGFCRDNNISNKPLLRKHYDVDEEIIRSLVNNDMKQWYDYGAILASADIKTYRRKAILQNNIWFQEEFEPNEDGFFNLCLLHRIKEFYVDNRLLYHYVTNSFSATHRFSERYIIMAENLLPELEKMVDTFYPNSTIIHKAIVLRAFKMVREVKEFYFTHPQNQKAFKQLKTELNDFLSKPIIKNCIKKLQFTDASNVVDFKNILLLKMYCYWIFLITERRKRELHND